MNTEILFLVIDVLLATAAVFMFGAAIRTTIQDKADCQAREQMARRIGSASR